MSKPKSVTVRPLKLRLTKKTTETFVPMRIVAEWSASDTAFIDNGDTPPKIANANHPVDEQLGVLPGLTIHLGKDGELYIPPDAVGNIVDAIRDGQQIHFVGRMASLLIKS